MLPNLSTTLAMGMVGLLPLQSNGYFAEPSSKYKTTSKEEKSGWGLVSWSVSAKRVWSSGLLVAGIVDLTSGLFLTR